MKLLLPLFLILLFSCKSKTHVPVKEYNEVRQAYDQLGQRFDSLARYASEAVDIANKWEHVADSLSDELMKCRRTHNIGHVENLIIN